MLATNLDVKQGAREGARLTAVNFPDTGNADLAAEICSRMDLIGSDPATTITWASDDGTPNVGEGVIVTVNTSHETPHRSDRATFLWHLLVDFKRRDKNREACGLD